MKPAVTANEKIKPPKKAPKKAIVLLSGGLDSATTLAMMHHANADIIALSFHYGQKHHHELTCARQLAQHYEVPHHVLPLPLADIGGSALTDDALAVPPAQPHDDIPSTPSTPSTYVPARNTIFIAVALALAERHDADAIVMGANHIDYSGYPDCRPAYFAAWKQLISLATKKGVQAQENNQPPPIDIVTPLLNMTKADIIRAGLSLGLNYAMTSSCYHPATDGAPCCRCDSCHWRMEAFKQCGMTDPLLIHHDAPL